MFILAYLLSKMTNSVKMLIVSNRRYSENQVHTSLKEIISPGATSL